MVLVGSVALAMSGFGCAQEGPRGGSGGASAGGSSGGTNDTGGTNSTGGAKNSGGTNNSGGSNNEGGSGGANEGGSGGSSEGGSGGSDEGGSGGANEGGSGGANEGGSGGTNEGGSGGSPPAGCSSPIKPANGTSGGVTDFTDYSTSSGKWGSTSGLYGPIYGYAGPSSSMTAKVDTTAKTLHATGTVAAGDYAGTGVSFAVCATVADFTKVQFTVSGNIGKCDLELQIKTFDQSPTDGDPPGGCASSCYNFPVLTRVAVPSSTAADVTKSLADFASWSAANAQQVVGLQWQVTNPQSASGDANTTCTVDLSVTNIKFQ